jgi:acyl carrier protein
MRDDLEERVIAVIADTFEVPAAALSAATLTEDVPGWDSLGHSVLLTRLARLNGRAFTEDQAAFVRTIGELVERVRARETAP